MIVLALMACAPDVVKGADSEDTGYAYVDTSPVVDTGDDSGGDSVPVDTDTGQTIDTGPIDTGAADIAALDLYPARLVVNPGAVWQLRAVVTGPDGARGDEAGGTWASSDPAIADVNAAGVVTAIGAGAVTLTIRFGGLEATAAVEVRDDGVATITVLDARTGAVIDNARVAIPSTAPVRTDASGVATLPVADGGPLTFTAWVDDDWNAVTITGTVARSLVVPIWPRSTDRRGATVHSAIDYSGIGDPDYTDAVAGIAAASFQGSLAITALGDLFSDDRTVSVYGVEADVPGNIFIEGVEDDAFSDAAAGPVAVWGLGGPIPIDEVSEGLNGTGDALALIIDHLDVMSWGATTGGTAELEAQVELDLEPRTHFDDELDLTLPGLTLGFRGDEEIFVLVTEERAAEGFVVTGLGLGTGRTMVDRVPAGSVSASLGTSILAYAQVGGLGSGGATCSSVAREGADGYYAFPEFLDVSTIDLFDAGPRALAVTADPGAQVVRVRLTDPRGRVHDILAPASWSGTIPNAVTDFQMAHATIEVLAVQAEDGAFDGWMAEGAIEPHALNATGAARTTLEN